MRIRALTIDDQPFLWEALYYAIHVPPGEAEPSPEIVKEPNIRRYAIGWMKSPDDIGFVAILDAMPVGAAWLRRWSGDERGYGIVDEEIPELSMSLLPGYRGRGIGTKLLRHLLSEAEKRYAAISLSVSESNPARRLYEREGFNVIGKPVGGSIKMVRQF
jgi:GNAT superfamily N-acetyltransferase